MFIFLPCKDDAVGVVPPPQPNTHTIVYLFRTTLVQKLNLNPYCSDMQQKCVLILQFYMMKYSKVDVHGECKRNVCWRQ